MSSIPKNPTNLFTEEFVEIPLDSPPSTPIVKKITVTPGAPHTISVSLPNPSLYWGSTIINSETEGGISTPVAQVGHDNCTEVLASLGKEKHLDSISQRSIKEEVQEFYQQGVVARSNNKEVLAAAYFQLANSLHNFDIYQEQLEGNQGIKKNHLEEFKGESIKIKVDLAQRIIHAVRSGNNILVTYLQQWYDQLTTPDNYDQRVRKVEQYCNIIQKMERIKMELNSLELGTESKENHIIGSIHYIKNYIDYTIPYCHEEIISEIIFHPHNDITVKETELDRRWEYIDGNYETLKKKYNVIIVV